MQRSGSRFAPAVALAGVLALLARGAAADSIDSFAGSVSASANGVPGVPIEFTSANSYVGSVDSSFASPAAESYATALQVSELIPLVDGFTVLANGSVGTAALTGGGSIGQATSLFDIDFTLTAARSFDLDFTRLDEDGVPEPAVFALLFSGPGGLSVTSAGSLGGVLGPGAYSLSVTGNMTSVATDDVALRQEGYALQLAVGPVVAGPSPVPLPAAAWGGLALIGGLGVARLGRRVDGARPPVR